MAIVATTHSPGRARRIGLWALPAYGALLGLSTVTHQPSVDDFDAYARYVTTDVFLASHLGASIFGAALAILGAFAVSAFLAGGRAARVAVAGVVLTTVTNVFMASTFAARPSCSRASAGPTWPASRACRPSTRTPHTARPSSPSH